MHLSMIGPIIESRSRQAFQKKRYISGEKQLWSVDRESVRSKVNLMNFKVEKERQVGQAPWPCRLPLGKHLSSDSPQIRISTNFAVPRGEAFDVRIADSNSHLSVCTVPIIFHTPE